MNDCQAPDLAALVQVQRPERRRLLSACLGVVLAACLTTAGNVHAAGHVCAGRVDPPRANYPAILIERVDDAESTRAAACALAERRGPFSNTMGCAQPQLDNAVRCLAVPTDPVIDRIERVPGTPGGVDGAVGPRTAYRCKLVQGRTTPWERVEATSWAEIEAAGQRAHGYRAAPYRGGCMPADVHDRLVAWASNPQGQVPANSDQPDRAATPQVAAAVAGKTDDGFRCLVMSSVGGGPMNGDVIFENGPRADMVEDRLKRRCSANAPSGTSCKVSCQPDTAASRADRQAREDAAKASATSPKPSAPPAAATQSNRSPWLEAVQAGNANGPCADAARTCQAGCGSARPGSSDAALSQAACRTQCDRTKAQCALQAAEPLTEGEPGKAAPVSPPPARSGDAAPSASTAASAAKKAADWFDKVKKAVPKSLP